MEIIHEIILTLDSIDKSVFLALNGLRHERLDLLMWIISAKWTWIPLYLLLTALLFRKFKWRQAVIYLILIIFAVIISDQICGSVFRSYFARMRPSNPDNPFSEFVNIVNGYRGGRFGFPSCHAANTFALVTFLAIIFRKAAYAVPLFLWAIIVSLSRIYLGVHYPGDLVAGMIFGIITSTLLYIAAARIQRNLPARFLSQMRRVQFGLSRWFIH